MEQSAGGAAYQGLNDDEPKGLHALLQRLLDLLRNLSFSLSSDKCFQFVQRVQMHEQYIT